MGCSESTEEHPKPQKSSITITLPTAAPSIYIPGVRYAFRSVSCGCYMDGGFTPDKEVVMRHGDPRSQPTLQWIIQACDPGLVSIMSVSSGCYLDGRGSAQPEIVVTKRPPLGDVYLNWEMAQADGNFTFRCRSNGHYLDGRAGEGSIAYSTNRQPFGDKYLQWTLEQL